MEELENITVRFLQSVGFGMDLLGIGKKPQTLRGGSCFCSWRLEKSPGVQTKRVPQLMAKWYCRRKHGCTLWVWVKDERIDIDGIKLGQSFEEQDLESMGVFR